MRKFENRIHFNESEINKFLAIFCKVRFTEGSYIITDFCCDGAIIKKSMNNLYLEIQNSDDKIFELQAYLNHRNKFWNRKYYLRKKNVNTWIICGYITD